MMDKSSKGSVHYTNQAANHNERCGLCKHFEDPHACAIVLGNIRRTGWCVEFERAPANR